MHAHRPAKRRVPLTFSLATIAVLSVMVIGAQVLPRGPAAQTGAQSLQPAVPMTLQEAWNLFAGEGQRWRKGAVIIQLASSNLSTDAPTAGDDGRRASWLAVLGAPDGNATLRLHSMGTVIDSREQGPGVPFASVLARPLIDSPRALVSALAATPDLLATQEKPRGYHFVLKIGSSSVIGVIGVIGVVQGVPSTVEIDAQSGAMAGRSVYGPDATGGVSYSADAVQVRCHGRGHGLPFAFADALQIHLEAAGEKSRHHALWDSAGVHARGRILRLGRAATRLPPQSDHHDCQELAPIQASSHILTPTVLEVPP